MIKEYFIDGILQIAMMLSVLHFDNNPVPPQSFHNLGGVNFQDANFGPMEVLSLIDIHSNRMSSNIDGLNIHPKNFDSINADEILQNIHSLGQFRRFPAINTQISAWLVNEVPNTTIINDNYQISTFIDQIDPSNLTSSEEIQTEFINNDNIEKEQNEEILFDNYNDQNQFEFPLTSLPDISSDDILIENNIFRDFNSHYTDHDFNLHSDTVQIYQNPSVNSNNNMLNSNSMLNNISSAISLYQSNFSETLHSNSSDEIWQELLNILNQTSQLNNTTATNSSFLNPPTNIYYPLENPPFFSYSNITNETSIVNQNSNVSFKKDDSKEYIVASEAFLPNQSSYFNTDILQNVSFLNTLSIENSQLANLSTADFTFTNLYSSNFPQNNTNIIDDLNFIMPTSESLQSNNSIDSLQLFSSNNNQNYTSNFTNFNYLSNNNMQPLSLNEYPPLDNSSDINIQSLNSYGYHAIDNVSPLSLQPLVSDDLNIFDEFLNVSAVDNLYQMINEQDHFGNITDDYDLLKIQSVTNNRNMPSVPPALSPYQLSEISTGSVVSQFFYEGSEEASGTKKSEKSIFEIPFQTFLEETSNLNDFQREYTGSRNYSSNNNCNTENLFNNFNGDKITNHTSSQDLKNKKFLFSRENGENKGICKWQEVLHNHSYPLRPGMLPRVEKDSLVKKEKENQSRNFRDKKKVIDLKLPFSIDQIINTPVERFTKMMNFLNLTETQLQLMRDIRRRGKNKEAAQNSRKRKMDIILTLEDEVNSLELEKHKLWQQRLDLNRDLSQLKQKVGKIQVRLFDTLHDSYGRRFSPEEFEIQQTPNGDIFLVPRINNNNNRNSQLSMTRTSSTLNHTNDDKSNHRKKKQKQNEN